MLGYTFGGFVCILVQDIFFFSWERSATHDDDDDDDDVRNVGEKSIAFY